MAQYLPGTEPNNIKFKLERLFSKLDSAYPDKIIVGLSKNHKNWAETVTTLYRELGYPDSKSFLEAYGYTYIYKPSGRPTTVDPKAIIQALQEKYPEGTSYTKIDDLFAENPEYLPNLKRIQTLSTEIFGMPLGQYLKSIGLLQKKAPVIKPIVVKKKKYIVCKVCPTGLSECKYYTLYTKSIRIGEHVEIPFGTRNVPVLGDIKEVLECDEETAPCNLADTLEIIRPVGKNEYEKNFLNSYIHATAAVDTDRLISETPFSPFCAPQASESSRNETALWACVRGLSAEIVAILDYLIHKDSQIYSINDIILITTGIAEVYIYTDDVTDIMQKFPDVKIAAFAETNDGNHVDLWYSKSGYFDVTDICEIGTYNNASKTKWTLKHSPVDTFTANKKKYKFPFLEDWNAINYVFTDQTESRQQLGK